MRTAFASLTSRLVLITVALVAVVSILLGLATTLVLHHYLMGQLDDKVRQSLNLAINAEVNGFGEPGAPPDPDHDHDYARGQGLDTLNAHYAGTNSWGQVLATGDTEGDTRLQNLTPS